MQETAHRLLSGILAGRRKSQDFKSGEKEILRFAQNDGARQVRRTQTRVGQNAPNDARSSGLSS